MLDVNFLTSNCRKHMDIIKGMRRRMRQREIERIHSDTFHDWFKDHVKYRLLF